MWDGVFDTYGDDSKKIENAFLIICAELDEISEEQVQQEIKAAYVPGILLSSLVLEASDGRCATPMVLRGARTELGLSVAQMAALLETDAQTIRRMEQTPLASTFRKPASRMVRLVRAYLGGYRPKNWPDVKSQLKPISNLRKGVKV